MKKLFLIGAGSLSCLLSLAASGTEQHSWEKLQDKRMRGETISSAEAGVMLNSYLEVIRGLPRLSAKQLESKLKPRIVEGGLPATKFESLKIQQKEAARSQCILDGYDYSFVQSQTVQALRKSLAAKDLGPVSGFLAKGFYVQAGDVAPRAPTLDSISVRQVSKSSTRGGSPLALVKEFARIEDVEIQTKNYLIKSRAEKDSKAHAWQAKLRLDIRGVEKNGRRRNDRLNVLAEIQVEKGAAKLQSLSLIDGESLVLSGRDPAFSNATASLGLDKATVHLRREAIRRGGYAMALSSPSLDKKLSLYVGSAGSPELFIQKDGVKFEKQDLTAAGLGNDTYVKAAAFVDLQNRGVEDLVLTRFDRVDGQGSIVVYKNKDGKKFSLSPSFIGKRKPSEYAMPMAIGDLNLDGYLDLYVGFPGSRDFTLPLSSVDMVKGLSRQGVFLSQKGEAMQDATDEALSEGTEIATYFPHAALVADVNDDSKPDILVVDDRGQLSPIYLNNGSARFREAAKEIQAVNEQWGMGVAVGDYDGDGLTDIAMSNVNFAATSRLWESCQLNFGIDMPLYGVSGVRLFKGRPGGKMLEVTAEAGLDWAGEGIAGVEFLDYNNDGQLDIFVSNGLWSSADRENDMSQIVGLGQTAYSKALLAFDGRLHSSFLDILASFRGDALTGTTGASRPSMAGHQRKRLFMNNQGRFTEVAYLENVDSVSDGYMLATADFNNDGRQDIFLRNADPGTQELSWSPVEVWENRHPNGNSLRISLRDQQKNRGAIGAKVVVTASGAEQHRQLLANNGSVQSEKKLIFGLGAATMAEKVVVYWPGGGASELKNVKAGDLLIERNRVGNGLKMEIAEGVTEGSKGKARN